MDTPAKNGDLYTVIDEDNVAWLHLDKHDSGTNVLSASLLESLYTELTQFDENPPRGLIIISDKKNGFVAGADVREFARLENHNQAIDAIQRGQEVFNYLEALPFPTVALIHGFCLGGGLELALACRYRVARDDAGTRLGLPEVRLGIHPGFGGSVRLTRQIGALKAMDLMLSGRAINSRTARRMGIVDHSVPERHMKTAALNLILDPPFPHRPGKLQAFTNHAWLRPLLAMILRQKVAKKARADHYPAPYALIDVWKHHADDKRKMLRDKFDRMSPEQRKRIRDRMIDRRPKPSARDRR